MNTRCSRIKQKHDTTENWAANNPILLEGEIGYDTDLKAFKIGDGTTHWNNLPYQPGMINNIQIENYMDPTTQTVKWAVHSGEIFNDYVNNKASVGSHAEGSHTEAIARGYKILSLQKDSDNYYIVKISNTTDQGVVKDPYTIVSNLGEKKLVLFNPNMKSLYYSSFTMSIMGDPAYLTFKSTIHANFIENAFSPSYISTYNLDGVHEIPVSANAHAEGYNTKARGNVSHSEGYNTIAVGEYQHVQGKNNIIDSKNKYAHIVGNGESNNKLSNAHTIDWDGNAWYQGNIKIGGTGYDDENATTIATTDSIIGKSGISKESVTFGISTFAGAKCFNIQSFESSSYVLDSVEGLEVGDTFSLNLKNEHDNCGTITAIDTTTKTVTVDNFIPAEDRAIVNYFRVAAKPEIGTTDFGEAAFAEGYNTKAVAPYAHVEGIGTTVIGNNGHAEGRETVAVYAAHAEGEITKAMGYASHTEGANTQALEQRAHAEGETTTASGFAAHSEGNRTTASGNSSHSEGGLTEAAGYGAHAEGDQTKALKNSSHAEGYKSVANSNGAHAEGGETSATGSYSHAEGANTKAVGNKSHAEGTNSTANGGASHAEGSSTATGHYSHSEGIGSKANGENSHSEGSYTTAEGKNAHAEGDGTKAKGESSHSEGYYTKAIGNQSHTEGKQTITNCYGALGTLVHYEGDYLWGITSSYALQVKVGDRVAIYYEGAFKLYGKVTSVFSQTNFEFTAINYIAYDSIIIGKQVFVYCLDELIHDDNHIYFGNFAHAEGQSSQAGGTSSHAEGGFTVSLGYASHSEGDQTKALANGAHSEGYLTIANRDASHAEGNVTLAQGLYSHAEGSKTKALGNISHAEGRGTIANSNYQHVEGQYNIKDTSNQYAHIVGNGSSDTNRSNAYTLDWNGNANFAGDITSSTGHWSLNTMSNMIDELSGNNSNLIDLADGGVLQYVRMEKLTDTNSENEQGYLGTYKEYDILRYGVGGVQCKKRGNTSQVIYFTFSQSLSDYPVLDPEKGRLYGYKQSGDSDYGTIYQYQLPTIITSNTTLTPVKTTALTSSAWKDSYTYYGMKMHIARNGRAIFGCYDNNTSNNTRYQTFNIISEDGTVTNDLQRAAGDSLTFSYNLENDRFYMFYSRGSSTYYYYWYIINSNNIISQFYTCSYSYSGTTSKYFENSDIFFVSARTSNGREKFLLTPAGNIIDLDVGDKQELEAMSSSTNYIVAFIHSSKDEYVNEDIRAGFGLCLIRISDGEFVFDDLYAGLPINKIEFNESTNQFTIYQKNEKNLIYAIRQ